tara:strand:- start:10667 stop:11179 length:513 start_codon:yes stop_codon:yes gene_type:complete
MTTEVIGPPEHMWRDEFVAAKRHDPDLVFDYLIANYGGELPPYEDVQFVNADSAIVWRRLGDGTFEKMLPQNVMASGLISIARKGFLLTPPETRQVEEVEDEVETGEPVATTEQPELEAVVPVIPLPEIPVEEPVEERKPSKFRFHCVLCDLQFKTPKGYKKHNRIKHAK